MIPDNYTCDGQMTIWEFFKPKEELPKLEDIIPICEQKYSRTFKKREYNGRAEYFDKYKKSEITLYEDHFTVGDCKRFISVDHQTTLEGFGIPCETLDQVLHWVGKAYQRADTIANRKEQE